MNLDQLRKRVDEIDELLLPLLDERMDISRSVAEYKIANDIPVFDPVRENEVLQKVRTKGSAHNANSMEEIFSSIMDVSKKRQMKIISEHAQKPLLQNYKNSLSLDARIVCYGAQGTFSDEVAQLCFPRCEKMYVLSFEEVFEKIIDGSAVYGILPVENSSTGSLQEIYKLLQNHQCYIVGEKKLKINHHLLGIKGAKLCEIKKIYSHHQAIMQCEGFIKQLGSVETVPYYNTSIAAKMVSERQEASYAAIAGKQAAVLYDLEVIAENINDNQENYTRFIVISKEPVITKDANKISIMFSLKNQSGSLYKALACFAYNSLNLIKIESRPYPGKNWQYLFFADLEGNIAENAVAGTIEAMRMLTDEMVFLGCYREL